MKPPLALFIPIYTELLTALLWLPSTLLQLDSFLLAELKRKWVLTLLTQ